jgi:iron complex transport system ATP-binding protein
MISTGVLLKNDIDYFVADALGAQCFVRDNLDEISKDKLDEILKLMEQCDFVIDSGFEENAINKANIEILTKALKLNKKVFSMTSQGQRNVFNLDNDLNIVFSKTESDLVNMMEKKEKI